MEMKLDEHFFNRYFSRINLGVRPDDACEDESSLAVAIPKMWSMQLEKEFSDDLWLSALIGTRPRSGIIEKTELTQKHAGDTLYISKAGALQNEGDLGTAHTLVGQEESLDISRVAFQPSRVGNAVCFRSKLAHSVSFEMKNEVKNLLGSWAAEKIEKLLIAACDGCSAANTLFAGTAASKAAMQVTDTVQAQDLLRLYVCLLDSGAKPIQELGGYYALILHPRQWYDLSLDTVFMSSVATASVGKTYDVEGFVGNFSKFRIFTSNLCHSQDSGGSPGCMVYSAYALGARALGLAWQQKWSWLEKGNVDYGESAGIGTDAWVRKNSPFSEQSELKNWMNSGKPKSFKRYGNPEPSPPLRKGGKAQRLELRRFIAFSPGILPGDDIVQAKGKPLGNLTGTDPQPDLFIPVAVCRNRSQNLIYIISLN